MFEYVFTRRISNRAREQELRELNAVLAGAHSQRTPLELLTSDMGDSATCLPEAFRHRLAGVEPA